MAFNFGLPMEIINSDLVTVNDENGEISQPHAEQVVYEISFLVPPDMSETNNDIKFEESATIASQITHTTDRHSPSNADQDSRASDVEPGKPPQEVVHYEQLVNKEQRQAAKILDRGKPVVKKENPKYEPSSYLRRRRAFDSSVIGQQKFMQDIQYLAPDYLRGSACIFQVPQSKADGPNEIRAMFNGSFPDSIITVPTDAAVSIFKIEEYNDQTRPPSTAKPEKTASLQKRKINQRMANLYWRLSKAAKAADTFCIFLAAVNESDKGKKGKKKVLKYVDPLNSLGNKKVTLQPQEGWDIEEYYLASVAKAKSQFNSTLQSPGTS